MEELNLWFEKYRPKKLSDCILSKKMKDIFQGYVDKKEIPNLLLTGYQGTGKTTLAKVLVNELNTESLFIDCSTESGKQMIQDQVVPFASTISLGENNVPKIIICDECIEENETVRIGTVNDYKDIPIKELEFGKEYPVVSFNTETKELENDTAKLVVDKETELYEVTLSNGNTIVCSGNHPFLIQDENGNIITKKVNEGIEGNLCLTV